MHVNARQMAFLGVLLALCEVLLMVGSATQISSASLIILAAATLAPAYFIGGTVLTLAYYTGALILGLLLLPDKFHVASFAVLGIYLLFLCILQPKLLLRGIRMSLIWILKLGLFNLFLIPSLVFLPQVVFAEEVSGWMAAAYGILANVVIILCDFLYHNFEFRYRKKIESFIKRR